MARLSPEATARVMVQLSRIGFTMSFLVWLTLAVATIIIMFSGAYTGIQALLLVLGEGLLCLVVYILVTMFLVDQWRGMNTFQYKPLPRKNPTRRIPVTSRGHTYELEIDDRVGG